MLTPVASLFWFGELLLEILGSRYAFRRRIVPLGLYLGFRAVADVACLGIYQCCSQGVYAWADLVQRTIQYVLFWVLAIFICCKVFAEDRHTTKTYVGMFGLIGIAAVIYFHSQPLSMAKLRDFELVAYGAAAAFVAVAFYCNKLHANRIWEWLGYALILQAGWDILITGLIAHGWRLESLYPVGAITALGIWAWACAERRATANAGRKKKGGRKLQAPAMMRIF